MRDVILDLTENEILESVLPVDRVITIDNNNITYLADTQFVIEEKYIREVINEW